MDLFYQIEFFNYIKSHRRVVIEKKETGLKMSNKQFTRDSVFLFLVQSTIQRSLLKNESKLSISQTTLSKIGLQNCLEFLYQVLLYSQSKVLQHFCGFSGRLSAFKGNGIDILNLICFDSETEQRLAEAVLACLNTPELIFDLNAFLDLKGGLRAGLK